MERQVWVQDLLCVSPLLFFFRKSFVYSVLVVIWVFFGGIIFVEIQTLMGS
jgi:hypothetical protein